MLSNNTKISTVKFCHFVSLSISCYLSKQVLQDARVKLTESGYIPGQVFPTEQAQLEGNMGEDVMISANNFFTVFYPGCINGVPLYSTTTTTTHAIFPFSYITDICT